MSSFANGFSWKLLISSLHSEKHTISSSEKSHWKCQMISPAQSSLPGRSHSLVWEIFIRHCSNSSRDCKSRASAAASLRVQTNTNIIKKKIIMQIITRFNEIIESSSFSHDINRQERKVWTAIGSLSSAHSLELIVQAESEKIIVMLGKDCSKCCFSLSLLPQCVAVELNSRDHEIYVCAAASEWTN